MNKSILLIGCTGFLGKCILYELLKFTNYTIYLVIRDKNNVTYADRIPIILREINCDQSYTTRIRAVNVTYERERSMNITIHNGMAQDILNNTNYVINALADVNFNRGLVKAVQNNTLTALNWLMFCRQSKNKIKYVYVSTAYVNYHLENEVVEEKVYERNMDESTLRDVLNGTITSVEPYCNTYTYSKQLAEILLMKHRDNVRLHIVRPSIIVCAHKHPFRGYGSLQGVNIAFFGSMTGTMACCEIAESTKINCIIPVDEVSHMCLRKLKRKRSASISHCSYYTNTFDVATHQDLSWNMYAKRIHDPIRVGSKVYKPYIPMAVGDSLVLKIYALLRFVIIKLIEGRSAEDIYKALVFTDRYTHVTNLIKRQKHFTMKTPLEETDISECLGCYIDNYLAAQIQLNPLFL